MMKQGYLGIVCASALCLAVPGVMAGHKGAENGGDAGAKADKPKLKDVLMQKYDANMNGVLDETEKDALKQAFANGDKKVAHLDKNKDGKLDDDEIAVLTAKHGKRKKNK